VKKFFPIVQARTIIKLAIAEDIGKGDLTTRNLISARQKGVGEIVFKENGILCGIDIVNLVLGQFDSSVIVKNLAEDGDFIRKGSIVSRIHGYLSPILTSERIILNFLQRLSGIATITAKYVEKVKGLNVVIMDTRKTTPGMRELEKYAVRIGGGKNHRMGLFDAVLIKTNHLRGGGLGLAQLQADITDLRRKLPSSVFIEIEARNYQEALQFAKLDCDVLMFDNMSIYEIKRAVRAIKKAYGNEKLLEASGGINLENVVKIARTGVDRVSVGELTHSARAIDISMRISSIRWK
jgi:nicotinate-nucleotide pyrophosphorylase (carboxylating)